MFGFSTMTVIIIVLFLILALYIGSKLVSCTYMFGQKTQSGGNKGKQTDEYEFV